MSAKSLAFSAWVLTRDPVVVSRFDEMEHSSTASAAYVVVLYADRGKLFLHTRPQSGPRGCDRCEEETAFFFELPEIEH